ncbi:AAA family ATPase [Clostridium algidicarnis]|uniref:AAA family ATPase n=1 Tax=Clostridium algidicarnis TaxID=37659 RepID=UPI000494FE63|nr:ATP-binding protein [Clostridium algidicarnis]
MLVGYKFDNYTSFYEETNLSMESGKDRKFIEQNTFKTQYGRLNKSALIFGANGSGKSNFVNALQYMCNCVLARFEIQAKIISVLNNFAFNETGLNKPKSFEVSFIVNNILYEYGFSILNGKIEKEYLYKKIKRRTEVFIRKGPSWKDISITSDFENVKHLIQNTREDALFLSWANFGNNEIAMNVYNWFKSIEIFDGDDTNEFLSSTVSYIEENEENKKKVLKFLNKAAIDVLDINLEIKEDDSRKFFAESLKKNVIDKLDLLPSFKRVDLKVLHKVYSENWSEIGTIEKNIGIESNGTKKMFEIAGPIIDSIENGKIIIIDEIDARLHPLLVNHLVKLFNSNISNAQLICTTHNIMLLDEDLRKDQIYFIDKNEYGVSKIKRLTEFKGIRKDSKIVKQYLLGAFSSIPNIK